MNLSPDLHPLVVYSKQNTLLRIISLHPEVQNSAGELLKKLPKLLKTCDGLAAVQSGNTPSGFIPLDLN